MVQVFTTTFQYSGQEYTALVTEKGASLTITLIDGSLQLVLPLDALPPFGKETSIAEAQSLVTALLAAVQVGRKTQQERSLSPGGAAEDGIR